MQSVKSAPRIVGHRILVLGVSSSGKTTLSRELSRRLGIPHYELDAIYWTSSGHSLTKQAFRFHVAELCLKPSWIIEGHDSKVSDLTWPRADTILWLDLPLFTVIIRALRRSLNPKNIFARKSNVLAALSSFHARRHAYLNTNQRLVRLTSPQQVAELISRHLH